MAKNDFDANLDAASKELQQVEQKVRNAKGNVSEELWQQFDRANEKYREAVRKSYK